MNRPIETSPVGTGHGFPYVPGAIGWVVHVVSAVPGAAFWRGVDVGDGRVVGPLEGAMYWPARRGVYTDLAAVFGTPAAAAAAGFVPMELSQSS
ncbi:hypothetical protein [Umezawaea sp. Da 62-37]|uniref:hypothetical protein n=1 Tax=Umezawaea sp. Da 62-37 TaxID=3075927 RepID=UPI0028F74C4D|nr:hypothetical protein [Umezawaea sp. Da 62-37]WNV85985.1 hypothetical protein RM788_49055 [Umezawaea sp. Da 62-37]